MTAAVRNHIAFLVLIFVFFALPVSAEAGVATLYKGDSALGQIPAMNGNNGSVVSIADAGALLGLSAAVEGEELHLTKGGDTVRIILNAAAAWYNNQLVPLYGAGYAQDGKWWLDVSSSVSVLQYFAGRGVGDRLRMEETDTGGSSPPVSAPPAVTVPVVASPPVVQPEPEAALADTDKVIVVSEPVTSSPPPSVPAVSAQSLSSISSILAAPGLSNAPGELRAVRWSFSEEKIRAVLDCSDGTNPEGELVSGKIVIPFVSVMDNLQGVPSPYENVRAELAKNADGTAVLSLSATGVRVEKLVLDDPRRIVYDFFFNAPTAVREAQVVEAPAVPDVSSEAPVRTGNMLVVLDPGHGGHDPGAVGNGFNEKDINLAVGLKMEKTLQSKGFDVKMTRRTDVYLKLQERTDFANNADADMFVSIHVNSLPPGRNTAGFEIYLMALPTDKDALDLAKIENQEYVEDRTGGGATADRRTELLLTILGDMQQNNKINESTTAAEVLFRAGNDSGLPMRRVAQAPFFVLRGAGMPAVLLEMGFISNAQEAKLLANSGYQQRIADAMTNGIYNYLRR